jgi:hypothetical protein
MIIEIFSIFFLSSGIGYLAFYYVSLLMNEDYEEEFTPFPIPRLYNIRHPSHVKTHGVLDTIEEIDE